MGENPVPQDTELTLWDYITSFQLLTFRNHAFSDIPEHFKGWQNGRENFTVKDALPDRDVERPGKPQDEILDDCKIIVSLQRTQEKKY